MFGNPRFNPVKSNILWGKEPTRDIFKIFGVKAIKENNGERRGITGSLRL